MTNCVKLARLRAVATAMGIDDLDKLAFELVGAAVRDEIKKRKDDVEMLPVREQLCRVVGCGFRSRQVQQACDFLRFGGWRGISENDRLNADVIVTLVRLWLDELTPVELESLAVSGGGYSDVEEQRRFNATFAPLAAYLRGL